MKFGHGCAKWNGKRTIKPTSGDVEKNTCSLNHAKSTSSHGRQPVLFVFGAESCKNLVPNGVPKICISLTNLHPTWKCNNYCRRNK